MHVEDKGSKTFLWRFRKQFSSPTMTRNKDKIAGNETKASQGSRGHETGQSGEPDTQNHERNEGQSHGSSKPKTNKNGGDGDRSQKHDTVTDKSTARGADAIATESRIASLETGMSKILAFVERASEEWYEEETEALNEPDLAGQDEQRDQAQNEKSAEVLLEEGEINGDGEPANKRQKVSLVEKLVNNLKLKAKLGPALVDADLADTVNHVVRAKIDDDKKALIKDKIKQYPVPENCHKLRLPKVEDLLWDQLESHTRSRDASLQNIQQTLLTAITALVRATDDLILRQQTDESLESEVTILMDSLILLGSVNVDLSIKRRELIKPDLNNEYKKLCTASGVITDNLFGDDLAQQVKNIAETNKIRNKIVNSRGSRGSARGRGNYRGARRPFSSYFRGWRGGRGAGGSPYYSDKQFGRSNEYWQNQSQQGNGKRGAASQGKKPN